MAMLSGDAQMRYLLQWFEEFSELQRSDFLPILAEKYAKRAYVNGIITGMSGVDCADKPMSLFQCRVKLFKEWFSQWGVDQKERFVSKLSEIDPEFAGKLNVEMENGVSHEQGNGEEILED